MNKKIFILIILLCCPFIGVVYRVGEFDNYYVPFLKKPWTVRIMYYDYIGERDLSNVPEDQLREYLLYCDAKMLNQFTCTLAMQKEAKKYSTE
ncbi:hypothetical protein [Neisseria sp.]|uniref:hypothetical protein n=1 Tax=Neisseria sp. TaxID=192066 RepID=UPI00359FCF27